MKKIVINAQFGGFSLPDFVIEQHNFADFNERWRFESGLECRTDPLLIDYVEKNGSFDLEVVSIPDDADWVIVDYDGLETLYWSMSEINTGGVK